MWEHRLQTDSGDYSSQAVSRLAHNPRPLHYFFFKCISFLSNNDWLLKVSFSEHSEFSHVKVVFLNEIQPCASHCTSSKAPISQLEMWPLKSDAAAAKAWLTKHTQLCIGIYDSVAILCYALVHSGVVKRQAAEPHLLFVELWKQERDVKASPPPDISLFSISAFCDWAKDSNHTVNCWHPPGEATIRPMGWREFH